MTSSRFKFSEKDKGLERRERDKKRERGEKNNYYFFVETAED